MLVDRSNQPFATYNPFFPLEQQLNQTFRHFDRIIDRMNHSFRHIDKMMSKNFQGFDSVFSPFFTSDHYCWPEAQFYTTDFIRAAEPRGSRCFFHRSIRSDGLSPTMQKTMFAVGRCLYKWEGNTAFKDDFHAHFKRLENYEKNHQDRPEILSRIAKGKELVDQASIAYDAVRDLYKHICTRCNQLRLEAAGEQRDSQLHELEALLQELNSCKLPAELTEESVANYLEESRNLTASISERLNKDLAVQGCARPDVQTTNTIAEERFATVTTEAVNHASQKSVQALQEELTKAADHAIERCHNYFNETKGDGMDLTKFKDLYQMRIGFWESQKQIIKNCIATTQQAAQQEVALAEAKAVDEAVFKQLNKALSSAHLKENRPLKRLIDNIEDISQTLLTALDPEKKLTRPVSFKKLKLLALKSSDASSLQPIVGSLEAFLLAERRRHTLTLEMLANEQRHFGDKQEDAIAEEYNVIIAAFKEVADKYKLNERLGCDTSCQEYRDQWNQVRAFAEQKRNLFRSKW